MKLTSKDIKAMVSECMSLLTEATLASDVYTKYYKDIIPSATWKKLMKGTDIMYPFHRKIADYLVREFKKSQITIKRHGQRFDWCDEDISTTTLRNCNSIANLASRAWNSSKEAQQFLNNTAKANSNVYIMNEWNLTDFLSNVLKSTTFTENGFIADCLYKICEDENTLVTTTLSYTASHRYYGDSHWCTASGVGGRYNGFDMFASYCGYNGILVQFVDKNNRTGSWQVQFRGTEIQGDAICDFFDVQKTEEELVTKFGSDIVEKTRNFLAVHSKDLCAKVKKMIESERPYYEHAEFLFAKRGYDKIRAKLNTQDFINVLTEELNYSYYYDEYATDSFEFTMTEDMLCYNGNVLAIGSIRTDFETNWMDEDEDEQEQYQEMIKASFFTEDEIYAASRSRYTPQGDVCDFAILFDTGGGETVKIIKIYFGYNSFEDVSDRVKKIESSFIRNAGAVQYIDMETGNVLFKLTNDGEIESLDEYDDSIKFGTIEMRGGEKYKTVLFEIDPRTAELRRLNNTFVFRHGGWQEINPSNAVVSEGRELLNERITVQQAYERFYSEKIPENIWNILISGTPDMTPFHKKAIDILLSSNLVGGDRELLAKAVQRAWSDADIRPNLIKGAKEGKFNDFTSLMDFINEVTNSGNLVRWEKDGLVKIFENDKCLITCTTSYSASRKYYGDSHWCTASGVDGRFPGHKMFAEYTVESYDGSGVLIQFVDKAAREGTCQAQVFPDTGNDVIFGQITNFFDKPLNNETFVESINTSFGISILDILNRGLILELYAKTSDNIGKEYDYWDGLSYQYMEKAKEEMISAANSDKMKNLILTVGKIEAKKLTVSEEEQKLIYEMIYNKHVMETDNSYIISVIIQPRISTESKQDIFSENAINYLSRAYDDDYYEYDIDDMYKTVITDKEFNIIAEYQGYFFGDCVLDRRLFTLAFGNLAAADAVDFKHIIDTETWKKVIDIDGYVEKYNDDWYAIGIYDWGNKKPKRLINANTLEMVDYEQAQRSGSVQPGLVRIDRQNIREMAVECLKRLLHN